MTIRWSATIAAGFSGIMAVGSAHAVPLQEFFSNTAASERSVAIILAISTQAYRYAAQGQSATASCIVQNFKTTANPDGSTKTPVALLSLMANLTEDKSSPDPEKRNRHIEGYLVSFVDHYCPPPKP